MCKQAFDARLQHYLRREIAKLPLQQRVQLKGIELCCKSVIPAVGAVDGVYFLRNSSGNVKTFGNMTCKNPWACPHCSAKMMAHYARKIAAAIDAMNAKGYAAFMLTLTVPHVVMQSCREVTDILYASWSDFFRNAWKTDKNHTNVTKAMRELGICHYVRVAEYTYGKNGWHPHFHCLFWLPKKNLQAVADWEDVLRNRWNMCVKRQYDKLGSVVYKQVFANTDERQALNIAVDQSGNVIEQRTSDYICGWGADKELTGNVQKKASHADHYTPYQLLEMAADGDEKARAKYIEFMLQVTRKPVHHRVNFDKKGLSQIAKVYMNTEGFKSVIAKKKDASWVVVLFVTREQWYEIWHENANSPIVSNLLYLLSINEKDLAISFLRSFGIELVKCLNHSAVVEQIFNAA